jgi:hypothetical protein
MVKVISGDLPAPLTFTFRPHRQEADVLLTELRKALAIYNAAPAEEPHSLSCRSAAIDSLVAVLNYLRANGVANELLAPLESLYAALLDISAGRSNSILERIDAGANRSNQPLEKERRAAEAVAYVELMVRAKGTSAVSNALKEAAKVMGCTVRQMEQKRKNIKRGISISREGREHYHNLIKDIQAKQFFPEQIEIFADVLLRRLESTKPMP